MKTLNLNLQRKWFDKHLEDKDEEYRAISPHWCAALLLYRSKHKKADWWQALTNHKRLQAWEIVKMLIDGGAITFKFYDIITFPNGMTPPIPKFEKDFKGISIGIGKKEWGAPEYPVFIIECGEPKNMENLTQ